VLASGQGNSAGGGYYDQKGNPLDGPDCVVTDGRYVYWTNLRGEAMRVPAGGGRPARVARVEAPVSLAVDATSIFVGSAASRTVVRVPTGGGAQADVAPAQATQTAPYFLALTRDTIIWSDSENVYACAKTGCPSARVLWQSTTGAITGSTGDVAVANSLVYFPYTMITGPVQGSGNASGVIESIPIDGTGGNGVVAEGFSTYDRLAADDTYVYATANNAVVRAPLSGGGFSGQLVLASGPEVNPWQIAVSDGYVYWTELSPPGRVMRVPRDGYVAPEPLSAPTVGARGLAVTSDAIYWATGEGNINKLAKPASSNKAAFP
jgi:hypothetical protein